ncbi:MAG: methyltransferase domain-containing protein [Proteobacteria bacterium]|nr:methyltransferase domain-containing protein [Pseudomonadota bacterium]
MEYVHIFTEKDPPGPILDLASGDCHNALYLAQRHLPTIACDKSAEVLSRGKKLAQQLGFAIEIWQVDLEQKGINPLPEDSYGGIVVFRYLHRPLIPCIRKALRLSGTLIYETFTVDQPRFGKPHNPNYLLGAGELRHWFHDWKIIHYFEGIKEDPRRSVAQLVCQKTDQM